MKQISYAQNGEDIVLARALSDVDQGFYIDIGAFDPVNDSVTKLFYDKGWNGINIEPVPDYYKKFVIERERDINLNIAVSNKSGLSEFFFINGTGLSTFNELFAQRHKSAGHTIERIEVPILTGNCLLSRFPDQPIHFLKVDAEGSEKDIFDSIDFKKHRPWIILSEATEPNSQVRVDSEWTQILLDNEYDLVYFDGLNTFYLAKEHSKRKNELAKPPNVFDNYITCEYNRLKNLEISETESNRALQEIIMFNQSTINNLSEKLKSQLNRENEYKEKISNLELEISKLKFSISQKDKSF